MRRRLFTWWIPGGLLVLGLWLLVKLAAGELPLAVSQGHPDLLESLRGLTTWPVWPLYLGVLLLAARFHRSRLVFALGILALTAWGSRELAQAEFLLAPLLPLLVSVALMIASILPERGLLTVKGILQMTIFLLPAAAIAWAVHSGIDGFSLLPPQGEAPGSKLQTWLSLLLNFSTYQPRMFLLAVFVPSIFRQFVRYIRDADLVARAFSWILLCALLAFWPAVEGLAATQQSRLFLALAVIIVGLATLEVSYDLAYRDELTRLPGRRPLEDRLHQLTGTYTLAMVDIDHFKKLNDRHGHDVGDQVLRMVAARLRSVGGGGRAYRYGGEEFTIVFAGRSLAQAREALEAVRGVIADTPFRVRRTARPTAGKNSSQRKQRGSSPPGATTEVRVTVSIGAAEHDVQRRTAAAVLQAADKALYKAKRAGRNRVQVAPRARA